jgi:metal-responsive CopG/Arc/MetJ family transcriptional regulator
MSVNARVAKHRKKLRAAGRRRLDVHLPNDLVEAADTFAKQHERYVRDVVSSALREYLTRHSAFLTAPPLT